MARYFGYLKDEVDNRDKVWSDRLGASPRTKTSVDLSVPGMQISDQGATNSCTGYAGAYAMRMAIYHEEGYDPGPLSGLFLYYIGRAVWDGESKDDGSYIRTLFKAMQLQGACIDKVFTAEAGVFKKPTWRAVRNGFKHKGIRSYRQINTVDEARSALSAGIPLVGGWSVGDDFLNWNGGDAYNGEPKSLGGHAMCVCGYNEDGEFTLVNSWGSDRGEGGFWRVTPEWLLSGGRLWACDTEENP